MGYDLITMKKIRKPYILAFGVWIFAIAPFIFWGENSIITVHDNLDEAFAFIQMYKLNVFLEDRCADNSNEWYFNTL